jgi:bifunctional UDP-N-acetylglucosamine pyrophosphorylase/glucosamine-1-phosphate N-acetyltransferase
MTSDGCVLAWNGTADAPGTQDAILRAGAGSFAIVHPWDLLRVNELLVGALRETCVYGEVHPAATVRGVLHLGPGSQLLPGVYIEGNVMIGRDCKIGPNCYLRGCTSIGDGCRIGQAVEVKNSILMPHVFLCHLSYCGDSILGENTNFGAGTITANVRHDGHPHRSQVGDALVDTGRVKFGTIVGDGVHTGIHTSIYPGRKLWPGTSTRPGAVVQRDLTA